MQPHWEIYEELRQKKFQRELFDREIESHIARLRIKRAIARLDPVYLTMND